MSDDILRTCGSKKLGLAKMPKRSRLYFLEPIALDTPYVEGLISYICRLAEAHNVSPGILVKQEVLPCFRETYSVSGRTAYKVQGDGVSVSVNSFPTPPYRKNPNEYGLLAWQYIEGLQSLTLKNNLQTLTIPSWSGTHQLQAVDLARESRSWCPECFQDWLICEQPVYEPLIWSIAAVTVCPRHHQPLRTCCPHCQKTQRPMSGRMQVGRCSYCLNWLNVQPERPAEVELLVEADLEWHHWVAKQIMDVLAATSRTPTLEIRDEIARVISQRGQPQSKHLDSLSEQIQWNLLEIFAHGTD